MNGMEVPVHNSCQIDLDPLIRAKNNNSQFDTIDFEIDWKSEWIMISRLNFIKRTKLNYD